MALAALTLPASVGAHTYDSPKANGLCERHYGVAAAKHTTDLGVLHKMKRCARTPAKRRWIASKIERIEERQAKLNACGNDSLEQINHCIDQGAARYGASSSWMHRVATCESHKDPYARNPSGASGLFQFMPSTWATTPYGSESIWSARYQSLAAAWMYVQGRSGEWVCT